MVRLVKEVRLVKARLRASKRWLATLFVVLACSSPVLFLSPVKATEPPPDWCYHFQDEYTPTSATMSFRLGPQSCRVQAFGAIHIEGVMRRIGESSWPNGSAETEGVIDCPAGVVDWCQLDLTLPHPNPEQADYEAIFRFSSSDGVEGAGGTTITGSTSLGPATDTYEGIALWTEAGPTWVVKWKEVWGPVFG